MRSGKVENTEYCFGPVKLPEGWSFPKSRLCVQLIDPSYVYGDRHLLVSIYSHLKGFRLAKDKSMNLLLRLTATKRITEAIKAKPKKKAILIVVGKNAKKEFKRIGFKESGKIVQRKNEMDAIEKTALVGIA